MTAKYMTVKTLAERWGFDGLQSAKSIYQLVERGHLPALRLGQAIRIPIAAVEAFEKANTTGAVEQ